MRMVIVVSIVEIRGGTRRRRQVFRDVAKRWSRVHRSGLSTAETSSRGEGDDRSSIRGISSSSHSVVWLWCWWLWIRLSVGGQRKSVFIYEDEWQSKHKGRSGVDGDAVARKQPKVE